MTDVVMDFEAFGKACKGTAPLLDRLSDLGPPSPLLVGEIGRRPTRVNLHKRQFEIHGQLTNLHGPIDWRQDPFGSRSWSYQLHTLVWLKPLLLDHAHRHNLDALRISLEIVLDWASAHLGQNADLSEFAWYDMAVGLRAPYLAYVLRACLIEGVISRDRAGELLQAVHRHGIELADERNHSADHNHGLFQDEGLYLLARQLPVLPLAPAWSELAVDRLQQTLASTICQTEGAHLEHSSAYQFAMISLVSRLADTIGEPIRFDKLLKRLRQTSTWHVMPTGKVVQLGDTDEIPAESWAMEATSERHGLKALYQSGYAFVRDGDSYLALSAAHHGLAHKHADDTGFVLVERSQVLLGDAGRWGYYESEPDRLYARSAFAHNVLTVDEQDFDWHENQPYRSGLLAAGEGHGWYAILAANPLLLSQGVEHRRLLLYRPAETLVVIDDLQAEKPHDYTRRFHFGPELEVTRDEQSRAIAMGKGLTATLADVGRRTDIVLDRGRDEPTRLGWNYPADRKRVPIWTATMHSRAADTTLTAVLTVERDSPAIRRAKIEIDRAVVETTTGLVEVLLPPDRNRAEIRFNEAC